MKGFLKLVEDGHPISGDDAKSLLRGVWLNPCFVRSLGVAIVEDRDLIGSVVCYSNQDSVAHRMANMEADPYFKSSVMGLNEPTSTSTFLRLFLSILIGHWGDESLLTELDNRMGKYVFGRRLDIIAKTRASVIERAGKEDVIEGFSFYIEDASHAKDLEPLRQLMISKYGQCEDIDIEAILEESIKHMKRNQIKRTLLISSRLSFELNLTRIGDRQAYSRLETIKTRCIAKLHGRAANMQFLFC
ncbi:hypothetical protein PHJA_001255000 [Phtheirospermum japonicum]|uniref:Uncharacterized protein n=1 Tax=Phtheirospermum japonicum TaxID=374723 RepID=A0A830BUH7_9LAMI|nr:hypothetical protein PHJA_001255000 [Phtheirospermum japonicum]